MTRLVYDMNITTRHELRPIPMDKENCQGHKRGREKKVRKFIDLEF